MNNQLTIITYHYVRPLKNSRYPDLKALDYDLFKKQIEYITENYNVVTMQELIHSVIDEEYYKNTPGKSPFDCDSWPTRDRPKALLAFDDGYTDHYTYVFPILQKYGIQGSFFIPALPIVKNTVLDVNKIHFILNRQSGEQLKKIIYLHLRGNNFTLDQFNELYDKYSEENRFDDRDTMFVKRFFQKWDNELGNKILESTFKRLVVCSDSESLISQELYMNIDQIKHMHQAGMYIGGHTYNHPHLSSLDEFGQYIEICDTKTFLSEFGVNPQYLTMSYPYGSHNEVTKELLKKEGFKLGIGIDYGLVNLEKFDKFNVPRIDCNDITKMMQENSKN